MSSARAFVGPSFLVYSPLPDETQNVLAALHIDISVLYLFLALMVTTLLQMHALALFVLHHHAQGLSAFNFCQFHLCHY